MVDRPAIPMPNHNVRRLYGATTGQMHDLLLRKEYHAMSCTADSHAQITNIFDAQEIFRIVPPDRIEDRATNQKAGSGNE